jgi:molecular chaperone GrpE
MSEGKPSESEALSAESPGVGTPRTVDELIAALDASRAAADQAREQALRAAAESENVRRRAQRDVDLLPVVDSLERAVESARSAKADGSSGAIADGVELSLKLFLDTLAKADLVQLDPIGVPFDPKFHQAVGMLESDRSEPGSVLQVLQKGYTLNGRLVRPAMVIVAKAPAGSKA